MKFTDGNWVMRPGVRASYTTEVYQFSAEENPLNVIVATRAVHGRGSLLDGPVLTMRISSPISGVIRVKTSHFAGVAERGPRFPLSTDADTVGSVTIDPTENRDDRPDYAHTENTTFRLYALEPGQTATATVKNPPGESLTLTAFHDGSESLRVE